MDTLEQLIKTPSHREFSPSQTASLHVPRSIAKIAQSNAPFIYADLQPFYLPFPFESFNDAYHPLVRYLVSSAIFRGIRFLGKSGGIFHEIRRHEPNDRVGYNAGFIWNLLPPRSALLMVGKDFEPHNYARIRFKVVANSEGKKEFEATCAYAPADSSSLFSMIGSQGTVRESVSFIGLGKKYQYSR
jgi:hypothetical protein